MATISTPLRPPVRHRPAPLELVWGDRVLGIGLAGGLVVAAGLVSAWLTPRGPITTPQALVSIVAALIVGVAGGLVTEGACPRC